MRMSADELARHRLSHVTDRKLASFESKLRMQDDLQKKIPQLLSKLRLILLRKRSVSRHAFGMRSLFRKLLGVFFGLVAIEHLENLVSFFDQIRTQSEMTLLTIPRTAVRTAQTRNQSD